MSALQTSIGSQQRMALLMVAFFSLILPHSMVSAADDASPFSTKDNGETWMEPLPVPQDPELEEQIREVHDALESIQQQIVRRKETLKKTNDPSMKTRLYAELEELHKEQRELEWLLRGLVEEARLSEQTEIDEALAKARWLERQQERQAQREEIIRDRQE